MKITLVFPDLEPHVPDWAGYYYVGVGMLSAVLKQAGHQTSLIHVTRTPKQSEWIRRLADENPDLLGFSSTSSMFPVTRELISWCRDAKFRFPIICGGIHPTIAPDEVIRTEGVDLICRGEGEGPLVELCEHLVKGEDIRRIPNLWIKDQETVYKNPLRPLQEDLDSLPFADRSIFAYQDLYHERQGSAVVVAGRGCPYDCTYCCNHLLRKIYGGGRSIRLRSVDHVIAEIQAIVDHYPFIKSLVFDDDIFFLERNWAEEFAEKYSRKVGLPFACHSRPNVLDERTVKLLKKAGCVLIKFGLESGNQAIRYNALNRHMTDEQIKRAFAITKKAGLKTQSYNLVGVPGETPATVLDTIKLNAVMGVDIMQFTICQPYQGTKLQQICIENNWLDSEKLAEDYYGTSIIKLDTISGEQIVMFRNYARSLVRYYRLLQKLPPKIYSAVMKISDQTLSSDMTARILNMCYQHFRRIVMLFRDRFRKYPAKV